VVSANDDFEDREKALLKVWDSDTWQELHRLSSDEGGLISVAFTPDGQKVVAAGMASVVVWDMTTFQPSLVNYPHLAHLTGVAVSRDGRRAASADLNGEVRIWDLTETRLMLSLLSPPPLTTALVSLHVASTAQPLHSLQAHTTRAAGVAFSPKGELLATCGMDGAIRLWQPGSSPPVTLHGPESGVRCLAFSPDGTRLATGGNDATIRVWDVDTRQELFRLCGHTDVVFCVTFSPDGRYIASGSLDGTVKIWKVQPPAESRFKAAAGPNK
jgi:WD40 repeat protein